MDDETVSKVTETILGMLDIRKLKSSCNYPNCSKKPEKEILIYEYTMRKSIGLATLYLCREHADVAKGLVTKIRNIDPKSIIESKQKEMEQA